MTAERTLLAAWVLPSAASCRTKSATMAVGSSFATGVSTTTFLGNGAPGTVTRGCEGDGAGAGAVTLEGAVVVGDGAMVVVVVTVVVVVVPGVEPEEFAGTVTEIVCGEPVNVVRALPAGSDTENEVATVSVELTVLPPATAVDVALMVHTVFEV